GLLERQTYLRPAQFLQAAARVSQQVGFAERVGRRWGGLPDPGRRARRRVAGVAYLDARRRSAGTLAGAVAVGIAYAPAERTSLGDRILRDRRIERAALATGDIRQTACRRRIYRFMV